MPTPWQSGSARPLRPLPEAGRVPVAIIGGGPVGMMLAMNLDALGVKSVIVNTEPRTRWHPKGGTQNARTMEHYRRLGLARQLRRLGMPQDHPTDVGYFTRLNAWEIARLPMPSEIEKMRSVANAAPTDQEPEPILRCNQMYVENLVFEQLPARRNIALRYGWSCVDWRDTGDEVELDVVEEASGRRETLRAAYIVGCDGAHSIVRRKLGIHYGGGDPLKQAYMGGTVVSSHLRSRRFYDAVPHKRCYQYWAVNPEIRSNVVVLNGKDEFLVMSQLNAPDDKPDEREIARRVTACIGQEIDLEFLVHSTWTAGLAHVADRFQQGRALLAGDSVHLFTPSGAFGMNTGIDDAANLGWKLAALVQGWGGPKLLETYEGERRPIALRNTAASKALTRNIGAVPVGPAIEANSAAGVAARREAGAFLSTFAEEFASLGIQLGARYDLSPVVVPDGTAPPPDDPSVYVASATPGGRAPHLWLGDRSSLFDHFGPGFTLLRLPGCKADTRGMEAAATARGVPLKLFDVQAPAARDLYRCGLALIRPDQHVAWRGDALPDDCAGLMARVTGG
jgi:2-polyprenyl-6-methoxyphenol hydroxylase-like FAD-dependent oxidoreductase